MWRLLERCQLPGCGAPAWLAQTTGKTAAAAANRVHVGARGVPGAVGAECAIPADGCLALRAVLPQLRQLRVAGPTRSSGPLRYSFRGARRLRVEDWRVVYTIEPPDVVLIVNIGHRKEVYET
jgi:mRNA interferase RelE/StbE